MYATGAYTSHPAQAGFVAGDVVDGNRESRINLAKKPSSRWMPISWDPIEVIRLTAPVLVDAATP
jgi:hypothetical protein